MVSSQVQPEIKNWKVVIIMRPRGVKITTQVNCVRYVENEATALRKYPNIRTYERTVMDHKKEIRYYSPAAIKWYNTRKIGDSFKTIYL
jgi:hypothetical protein